MDTIPLGFGPGTLTYLNPTGVDEDGSTIYNECMIDLATGGIPAHVKARMLGFSAQHVALAMQKFEEVRNDY